MTLLTTQLPVSVDLEVLALRIPNNKVRFPTTILMLHICIRRLPLPTTTTFQQLKNLTMIVSLFTKT
jgi:hypothetical protein